MPGALRSLLELGVDPPGEPFTGITYRMGARSATARFRRGPGRGVRRTALSTALRAAVDAQAIPVHPVDVAGVEQRADHVRAGGLQARWLVAADGLHSPVRRALGADPGPPRRARYGLRRHYDLTPWTDTVEVSWADDTEAYVTPVGPHTVGVAVLTSRRGRFDDHLRHFPDLQRRLHGACVVSGDRGAGPLRQDVGARVHGRVLLVGDAAGYLDALTGEGIAVGVAGAEALVACLAAGRPDRYEQAWRRVTRPSRVLTAGLLWARHRPALAATVVPLAQRSPALFAAAVDRLAG